MGLTYFDRIAGLYRHAPDFKPDGTVLRLLDLSPEARLLDAGGGTGRVAAALRNRVGLVVVADPARKMLHYALENHLPAVCSPAEQLPFSNDSFQRIIMLDALHHVTNQRATAKELWRVLAPGGKILIIDPDLHFFSARLMGWIEKALLMRSRFLTGEGIADLFSHPAARITVTPADKYAMVLIEKVRQM